MPRGIPNTRAKTEKTQRRRKRGGTVVSGIKLAVSEDALDRDNFEYRYINDTPGRIEAMTEHDDWDLVNDPNKAVKDDSTNEGSKVSVVVGKGEYGNAQRAYLARKPKEFYKEDQAEKSKALDRTMAGIKQGVPQGEAAGDLGQSSYVPSGGINIDDGRRK